MDAFTYILGKNSLFYKPVTYLNKFSVFFHRLRTTFGNYLFLMIMTHNFELSLNSEYLMKSKVYVSMSKLL